MFLIFLMTDKESGVGLLRMRTNTAGTWLLVWLLVWANDGKLKHPAHGEMFDISLLLYTTK